MSIEPNKYAAIYLATEQAELKFNCGCGYQTTDIVAATDHADQFTHKLQAQGLVRPTTSKLEEELSDRQEATVRQDS